MKICLPHVGGGQVARLEFGYGEGRRRAPGRRPSYNGPIWASRRSEPESLASARLGAAQVGASEIAVTKIGAFEDARPAAARPPCRKAVEHRALGRERRADCSFHAPSPGRAGRLAIEHRRGRRARRRSRTSGRDPGSWSCRAGSQAAIPAGLSVSAMVMLALEAFHCFRVVAPTSTASRRSAPAPGPRRRGRRRRGCSPSSVACLKIGAHQAGVLEDRGRWWKSAFTAITPESLGVRGWRSPRAWRCGASPTRRSGRVAGFDAAEADLGIGRSETRLRADRPRTCRPPIEVGRCAGRRRAGRPRRSEGSCA